MTNIEKSEQIYSKLYDSASSKKRQISLNNIKKACTALALKYHKLTPATIGKYCEKAWGTPREQSIRNNSEYVQYISIREDERPKTIIQKEEAPIIVKDQAAQVIIDVLSDEIKDLKKTISNLKNGMRQIAPIDIDKFISHSFKMNSSPIDLLKQNPNLKQESTLNCETLLTEVVYALNQQLLEKYYQVSIDYKNGIIFNKNTGTTYWKNKN